MVLNNDAKPNALDIASTEKDILGDPLKNGGLYGHRIQRKGIDSYCSICLGTTNTRKEVNQ
jgi:hypothetical protein